MAKRLPECKCVVCARFNVDAAAIMRGVRELYRLDSSILHGISEELYLGEGCDWCGNKWTRIPFVPQILKDFLRIEYLCEWCRNTINSTRSELRWPICWGNTPDDEIRWFLLELILQKFNKEVHALSPAQIAKDKAFQEWLDSLPKYEEKIESDLDIRIKPRFKIKRRSIDCEASTS